MKKIINRMVANISKYFSTEEGTYTKDIVINPIAIELKHTSEKIAETMSKRFSGNAKGNDLDIICQDDGIYRIPAIKATGKAKISGLNGYLIKKGMKLVRKDNVTYTILEDKEIVNISTIVNIECDIPGTEGNCSIGDIIKFSMNYPGLNHVINEEAITNGKDKETDEELHQRRNLQISSPATSWNQHWFKNEALKISSVGIANCIPRPNGAGTVKVIIGSKDYEPSSNEDCQKVLNHLEKQFLNDITITVNPLKKRKVNISIEAILSSDFDSDSAKHLTIENLNAYFKAALFKSETLYYSYILEVLTHCKAINTIKNVTVNNNKENVVINDDELAFVDLTSINLN
ncbi:MAG: baseplate J/gp47 family protein [Cetobacterium sp.]|nr:baseplate J/gp47 family protein [Cetobacterium sp.]